MRATGAKKLKISKPYFQISVNFENPQNPSCMIWKSILKNLKNLNLEVAGGDLKARGPVYITFAFFWPKKGNNENKNAIGSMKSNRIFSYFGIVSIDMLNTLLMTHLPLSSEIWVAKVGFVALKNEGFGHMLVKACYCAKHAETPTSRRRQEWLRCVLPLLVPSSI